MKTRGRPRTNERPRAEQLRLAKRAQRERQRRAGIQHVQLDVPRGLAEKFKAARADPDFLPSLDAWLDTRVLRIAQYPQLRDLAWNRKDDLITARAAFQLYERNWRFIDVARLDEQERALIDRLAQRFGNGIIHA